MHRYEVVDNVGSMAEPLIFAKGSLRLADFIYFRQRIVFDLFEMVAEVIGFSELVFIFFGLLLSIFYTPYRH